MKAHEFWQEIHSAETVTPQPYEKSYPARLPDGRILFLPIRPLGESGSAIASLILNQAALAVEDALAGWLAERLAPFSPDIVVGLPTLGLSLARLVAAKLGHRRYIALGTSRKFWYDDELSVPVESITSPGARKRLYVDPRMLPLLENARIALVDDVISTGTSISAGLDLLGASGHEPVVIGAAMLQTRRWADRLESDRRGMAGRVRGVIETPLLERAEGGWRPLD
ncbi:MAG: phosphoribosyltransferase [Geminicoccaceae bacterium]|nr:phosphoribosyltransferase [Geminicoccaceae bacterium]MCB9943921.1 phosphoribosyltransferase [Geminicoccaceae bacterium]